MKRALAVTLACFCVVGAPRSAGAEEDALDAIAEARFKEGIAAARQGDYERARASFLQTLALSPGSAKVLLNLAIAEHASGRALDALGHLKAYFAHPQANATKVAELKRSLFVELWGATGHLRVTANRGEPIALDGAAKIGNAPLADLVDVSPGPHVVTAGPRSVEVAVLAGETKDVLLHSDEQPPASGGPYASPRPTPEPAPASNSTRNVVALSLGVVGLTGLGAGVGFMLAAGGASDELERAKAETGTGADACVGVQSMACQSRSEHADALERNRTLMWTGFIAGGLALAGAAVTFFVWPRSSDRAPPVRAAGAARVAPWIGPNGVGLSFQGDL